MASLTIRNVFKRYGAVQVLHGVSLEIVHREFVVLLGPSGCGKSTLLRMIAGLEEISGGDVLIGEQRVNDVPAGLRDGAMVFQNYALYPHMSAYDNMAFGLRNIGLPPAEVDRRVRETAEVLRIGELLGRRPHSMSGGQRQRVAIGRAIVREPKVFLFDEPLSNLDAALRLQMRVEIARLHDRLSATMIFVTHDQSEAMTLADRIVVMNAGRIEQVGTPLEVYHRPRNLFVAGFVGSPKMNLLPARVTAASGTEVQLAVLGGRAVLDGFGTGALRPGTEVTLGLRPEAMRLRRAGGTLPGRVEIVEQLGNLSLTHVLLADGAHVVVESTGAAAFVAGESVSIDLDAQGSHLFDGDGLAVARAAERAGPARSVFLDVRAGR